MKLFYVIFCDERQRRFKMKSWRHLLTLGLCARCLPQVRRAAWPTSSWTRFQGRWSAWGRGEETPSPPPSENTRRSHIAPEPLDLQRAALPSTSSPTHPLYAQGFDSNDHFYWSSLLFFFTLRISAHFLAKGTDVLTANSLSALSLPRHLLSAPSAVWARHCSIWADPWRK